MEIYSDDLKRETTNELSNTLIYIKNLDQGSFGKVVLAKEKQTQKELAVKIIEKGQAGQNYINKLKEEIYILKKLSHKNIVKFYGYFETSNKLLIEMEYLKYGTLDQWMKDHEIISEEEASTIIKRLLLAIEYLHNNHIVHRDIKPKNIMLSEEDNLNSIKIIDFGLSAQNFDYFYNSDYCGTFIYMAPEEINKKSYNLSVDIWSVGILMYMLLNNGEHPFYCKGDSRETFINKLKSKNLKFNNKISYMAMNLIKKLLETDPIKRYKANDALKHPWITRNPEDKIPQTFNDQLNNENIINNARELAMISIFLNYVKKHNNILNTQKIIKIKKANVEEKRYQSTERKNNKKFKIFKISREYIKRCENISEIEKAKLKEIKEKCLDVISTVDESEEKNNFSNSNLFSTDKNKSNMNFSIFNFSNCKRNYNNRYSIIKRKNKNKVLSAISKEIKEKPIMLFASKNYSFKQLPKKENECEESKTAFKMKPSESIFLTNLDKECYNNNFVWSLRSSSKKEKHSNKIKQNGSMIIKRNKNNNLNDLNSFYRNLGIEPINLFLNKSNNSQVKSNKCIFGKNKINAPFERNLLLYDNKTISSKKQCRNSFKLPKIYLKKK